MFVKRSVFLTLALVFVLCAEAEPSNARTIARNARTLSIAGTMGVISLDASGSKKNPKIQFLNKDGSLWYEHSLQEDNETSDSIPEDFEPLAFHPDYYLLVLKCVRRDARYFEVIVNEASGSTKLVRVRNGNMRFQTWEDHVVKIFAVGFDHSTNPVRRLPGGRLYPLDHANDVMFRPIQVKGKWLKVSFDSHSSGGQQAGRVGWIQWRKNKRLLIELFHLC